MKEKGGLITLIILGLSLFFVFKKLTPFQGVFSKSDYSIYHQRIAFGKTLFFDKQLSKTNKVSCASCHNPTMAFTDGEKLAKGIFGRKNLRNAPTLLNVQFTPYLMMDGAIPTLEMQALAPIQDHNEMGMMMKDLILKLRKNTRYNYLSKQLYGSEITPFVLTKSLAMYQRSLLSNNTKFDVFYYQKKAVFNKDELKGWELFSDKYKCVSCHSLPFFTNYELVDIGITQLTDKDLGRYRITGDSTDIGKFKVPTLRSIGLSYPYGHNGNFISVDEIIINHFSNNGNESNKDRRLNVKKPTVKEIDKISLFLNTLSSK